MDTRMDQGNQVLIILNQMDTWMDQSYLMEPSAIFINWIFVVFGLLNYLINSADQVKIVDAFRAIYVFEYQKDIFVFHKTNNLPSNKECRLSENPFRYLTVNSI